MPGALVLMDYQNVHLTAHECFSAYGTPVYKTLIEPGKFADQVVQKWNADSGDSLVVGQVLVYRGIANSRKEPALNSRGTRQKTSWERDARVSVNLRPLRYPRDWPDEKAQEKGIDVMLALALVRAALDKSFDRLFVATRDTDLLPAIEMADDEYPGQVTLVSWAGQSSLKANRSMSAVTLAQQHFNRSRDLNNYA